MSRFDVDSYLEHSGVRKARFGGYETEDVRQAIQALCSEYEKRLAQAESVGAGLQKENNALQQQYQQLAAKNRVLANQNAGLASSSERSSRMQGDLELQVSSLKERNHALGDQLAMVRLKNADLNKENDALKERAADAEAALRMKGRDLDARKAELEANRQQRLDDADAEAKRLVNEARQTADRLRSEAELNAEAVERTARSQMQEQAQKLMDSVVNEAQEIQNAAQLRLNDLQQRINAMETRRKRLGEYLLKVSQALIDTEQMMRTEYPKEEDIPPMPEEDMELKEISWEYTPLDLAPDIVAKSAEEIRAERTAPPPPPLPESAPNPQDATPLVELAPHEDSPAADGASRQESSNIRLLDGFISQNLSEPPVEEEKEKFSTPLREVPGEIFSYPVISRSEEPSLDMPPPRTVHLPVMPDLSDSEDEEVYPASEALSKGTPLYPDLIAPRHTVVNTPSEAVPGILTHRRAVYAVRALQRLQQR